jgi:transcriptional regulator with XRE-family HTH domain
MANEFGKELRKLRIDHSEKLLDMAANIEVSVAFLSAVETGRKEVPPALTEKVIARYKLDDFAARTLRNAADASRKSFRLAPQTQYGRETVALLARKMDSLSTEDFASIQRILEGNRGK